VVMPGHAVTHLPPADATRPAKWVQNETNTGS
jgi:hypothetical protein